MLIVLINTSKSLEHSIIQLTLITLKYVHSFLLFLSFFYSLHLQVMPI